MVPFAAFEFCSYIHYNEAIIPNFGFGCGRFNKRAKANLREFFPLAGRNEGWGLGWIHYIFRY